MKEKWHRMYMEVDGKPGTLVWHPDNPEYASWSMDRVMVGKFPYYQLRYNGEKSGDLVCGLKNAQSTLLSKG